MFKYNNKVRQIVPNPWISSMPYNPTKRMFNHDNKRYYIGYIAGKCELINALDNMFLFSRIWPHRPDICYCIGINTGRLFTFKLNEIELV